MKKYIGFNYKYPSSEDERCELIKNVGFDGVFIYSQYVPERYINKIINSGLEIETLHLSYKQIVDGVCVDSRFVNNLWLNNDESRIYLESLFRQVDFAYYFGIKKVVMHITGGNTPPPISEAGIQFIEKLLRYCEDKSIELCLENLRFLDYLIFIFSNISSRFLRFCFDSGHANYMTQNSHDFPWNDFGKYLSCLHLNDNNGLKDMHSIPFTGTIEWSKLSKEIISYNSSLNLTLEVRSNEQQRAEVCEIDFLKQCYNSLQKIENMMVRT